MQPWTKTFGQLRPLAMIGAYAFWVVAFRLFALTLITYFNISPTSHFQDVSDAFSSNEVSLMGLAGLLFICLHVWIHPVTATPLSKIFSRPLFEEGFAPGFRKGSTLAGILIGGFILLGTHRFLGSFIQFGEAPLELFNTLLRMGALAALAYCEEFLFRQELHQAFSDRISIDLQAQISAVLYCLVKCLQFDLGVLHLVSLYLLSMALYYRLEPSPRSVESKGSFALGAGVWAALLILFHPLLSLPIFGNQFSGVFLVKWTENTSELLRLFSGGAGGPLSSFTFQGLLIIDISRSILLRRSSTRLAVL